MKFEATILEFKKQRAYIEESRKYRKRFGKADFWIKKWAEKEFRKRDYLGG
jgi:serine/threonine-protein kinase RIO1